MNDTHLKIYRGIVLKLWFKILNIFFLFSLCFSSFNRKYLKLTEMDITHFAMKLFFYRYEFWMNCILFLLQVSWFQRLLAHGWICIYRVSQKKWNSGFSVPCELKVLYLFTSLDQTSSAEENDTMIIEFGWVVLILCPFLEIRSFSNFARFLRPMSRRIMSGIAFHYNALGNPVEPPFFCWHGSMGFPKTQQWKAIPNIILCSSVAKILRTLKLTVF